MTAIMEEENVQGIVRLVVANEEQRNYHAEHVAFRPCISPELSPIAHPSAASVASDDFPMGTSFSTPPRRASSSAATVGHWGEVDFASSPSQSAQRLGTPEALQTFTISPAKQQLLTLQDMAERVEADVQEGNGTEAAKLANRVAEFSDAVKSASLGKGGNRLGGLGEGEWSRISRAYEDIFKETYNARTTGKRSSARILATDIGRWMEDDYDTPVALGRVSRFLASPKFFELRDQLMDDAEHKSLKSMYGGMPTSTWEKIADAYRKVFVNMQTKGVHINARAIRMNDVLGVMQKQGSTQATMDVAEFKTTPGFEQFCKDLASGGGKAAGGGKGISRGRGLVKDTFTHLTSRDIEKPAIYHPLGKYYVNKKRLMENVLYLRGAKGNAISKFPAQKISPELTSCLLLMLKEENPSFKMLSVLSEDDRILLAKINSKCALMDKFDLPRPTKALDEDEQLLHRFDILRGEIAAGNTNKSMIAEFKQTLIRFAKENRVPMRECNEIIAELKSLGM